MVLVPVGLIRQGIIIPKSLALGRHFPRGLVVVIPGDCRLLAELLRLRRVSEGTLLQPLIKQRIRDRVLKIPLREGFLNPLLAKSHRVVEEILLLLTSRKQSGNALVIHPALERIHIPSVGFGPLTDSLVDQLSSQGFPIPVDVRLQSLHHRVSDLIPGGIKVLVFGHLADVGEVVLVLVVRALNSGLDIPDRVQAIVIRPIAHLLISWSVTHLLISWPIAHGLGLRRGSRFVILRARAYVRVSRRRAESLKPKSSLFRGVLILRRVQARRHGGQGSQVQRLARSLRDIANALRRKIIQPRRDIDILIIELLLLWAQRSRDCSVRDKSPVRQGVTIRV